MAFFASLITNDVQRLVDPDVLRPGFVATIPAERGCSDARRKRRAHRLVWRTRDLRLTEALEQNEYDLTCFGFLVDLHQVDIPIRAKRRRLDGQLRRGDRPREARTRRFIEPAESHRQIRCHHHAATDCLAMQPFPVTQAGLNCMTDSVAEID